MSKRLLVLYVVLIGVAVVFLTNRDSQKYPDDNMASALTPTEIYENTTTYTIDAEVPGTQKLGGLKARLFIQDYVEEFKISANKQAKDDVAKGFPLRPYDMKAIYEEYESDDYVSHVFRIGEFTGGASGNDKIVTFTFSKEAKSEVYLSEILSSSDMSRVLETVKNKLYEINEVNSEETVFRETISSLTIDDLNKFYITDNEIVVSFSKYEVAPGAVGAIDIEVDR